MTKARDLADNTQNTKPKVVDAKGDIIAATAADTAARLAVGANGETLVADSSTTTGLRWQGNYAAGKNKIINGDFGIWQRGTSFTLTGASGYTADRFQITSGSGGVVTVTQGAFTPGTAPVAGVESQYFLNLNYTTSGTGAADNGQYIEDVRTFAGETVTVSVYAKVTSGTHSITPNLVQRFGSGGSSAVNTVGTAFTATTSWQRFTETINVPSVSGKTIGAGSSLQFRLNLGTTGVTEFQFWGFQVEAGSVATAFQTATGTVQGELAACQRYYYRTPNTGTATLATGTQISLTQSAFLVPFPMTMRVAPTSFDISGLSVTDNSTYTLAGTFSSSDFTSINATRMIFTTSSTGANHRPSNLIVNSSGGYLGASAEL